MVFYKNGQVTLDLEQESDFLNLPNDVQMVILSHLSPTDILSFGKTCRQARQIIQDKYLWKKTLWTRFKAINVALPALKSHIHDKDPSFFLHDKTFIDPMELAVFLNSKTPYFNRSPAKNSVVSRIQELFRHQNDPKNQTKARDPCVLFLSAWQTKCVKDLQHSVLFSYDGDFKPCELVEGDKNWNGIGGGVKVDWRGKYVNFIPIRKGQVRATTGIRAKLSMDDALAMIASVCDGIIYYFDGRCACPSLKKPSPKSTTDEERLKDFFTANFDVLTRKCYVKPVIPVKKHTHFGDIGELQILMKSFNKDNTPPILVFIVGECSAGHEATDYHQYLEHLQTPWMIIPVHPLTYENINLGLRWLLRHRKGRTL